MSRHRVVSTWLVVGLWGTGVSSVVAMTAAVVGLWGTGLSSVVAMTPAAPPVYEDTQRTARPQGARGGGKYLLISPDIS